MLVRQVLTESLLIAGVGGAIGIIGAWWAVRAFVAAAPVSLPRLDEVAVDGGVLLFALGSHHGDGRSFRLDPRATARPYRSR